MTRAAPEADPTGHAAIADGQADAIGDKIPLEELEREPNRLVRLLKVLGPGLITGAADDDPSAVSTYAVAGASFGYAPLWTAPVTLPMMAAVVYLCGKIGMVAGEGLGGVLRHHAPRWVLYPLVLAFVVANTLNAGADIGAVAAGLNLLVPSIPEWVFVAPIALVVLGFQLRGSYQLLARFLKWLTLGLFAYVLASVLAHPDPGAVLRGTLVPTFAWDEPFLATLVAILGTTLSPYLFFWQASQQVEEKIATGRRWIWQRRGASNAELKYLAWDVNAGMAFSNVVMYFIILGTAATLHEAGKTDVATAADAAQALRPLAGDAAGLLFALGFIGVGMLAIPVLTTGAAYALSDALGWPATLHAPPERAKRFYAVIVATTIVGMALNFVGINPIQALVGVAVLNGLLLPVLLAVVLVIANRRAVMGERVNGAPLNFLCGATLVVSVAAALGLAWTFVQG